MQREITMAKKTILEYVYKYASIFCFPSASDFSFKWSFSLPTAFQSVLTFVSLEDNIFAHGVMVGLSG